MQPPTQQISHSVLAVTCTTHSHAVIITKKNNVSTGALQLKLLVLAILVVWRIIVTSTLVATGSFNTSFYTYLNYAFFSIALIIFFVTWLMAVARIDQRPFKYALLYLFPAVFENTLLVGFLIVPMIIINDNLIEDHTIEHGGTMTHGQVHAGDWIMHQLPIIESFILLLVLLDYARYYIPRWVKSECSSKGSIAYKIYFFFAAIPLIVTYFASVDYEAKYHIGIVAPLAILIIMPVCLLLNGSLYACCITDIHGPRPVATTRHNTISTQN